VIGGIGLSNVSRWPGEVRRRLLADPVLAAAAARLGATPVQVALAWLLDLAPNILLIPRTSARLTSGSTTRPTPS
jgi:diketogulonate reductase-like aldo/keto reductase